MRFYRCRCGKAEAFGSMSPARCIGCGKCGTTLELAPSLHRAPDPHEWVKRFDEETGKPCEICDWCSRRKTVVEEVSDA